MDLIEETLPMKLYWLADVESVFAVWSGTPRAEGVGEALAACARVIASRKPRRWITDASEVKIPAPEARFMILAWLTNLKGSSLVAWAFIPPLSAVAALAVKDVEAESLTNGVEFRMFGTLDESKAWVATR